MITYSVIAGKHIKEEDLERRVAEDEKILRYKREIEKLNQTYIDLCNADKPVFTAERARILELKEQRRKIEIQIAAMLRKINKFIPPPRRERFDKKIRYWKNMIKRRRPAIRNQMCREYIASKQAEWRASWIKKGAPLPNESVPDQQQKG